MSNSHISSRLDGTPAQARDARARVWAFVFECYEAKKNPAADRSVRGGNDGTETKEASADGTSIHN